MRATRSLQSLAALVLLTGLPVAGQSGEACRECHDTELTSPLHGDFACGDCHGDVEEAVHPDEPVDLSSRVLCTSCHGLSEGLVDGSHTTVECSDCHGAAHQLIGVDDLASPMSPLHQYRVCGGCHEDPPELLTNYLSSVHSRALLVSGLTVAPSCADCHGTHDIFPKEHRRSSISAASVPNTCGSCHALILDTWRSSSAHGQLWLDGDTEMETPTCVDCHTSHAIHEPTTAEQRRAFPESCGDCHEQSLATFRDSFHGRATDLGFVTAAICSDCHTPHANLPAADPRSSVHPDNLGSTCGSCHGNVPAAFLSFDPHADPSDPTRSRPLHWVWLFMHGLLLSVIGFFLAHDLLWLQRSVVGWLRGEHRPAPTAATAEERWVRRFDTKSRILHLVVIITFLVLALTGLPLKFHFSPWAQKLAQTLGGVGTTSALHRLAALATFGYFLFHLVDLARRTWVRRERGLFMGWRSMTPRWKDLTDLFANVRYFVYLGRRPRFDRWTYWEKFDYFAVFWGVVIIGASGLMLWFPHVVTRFLPGWVLNAAFVIHSEEAFLAVGFIFVFHFFHTHLRPESFPMDTVIFLGSQPLSRFKEERPVEYRRLVESGTLDGRLVDPPTRRMIRRAYLQGSIALAIGLLLAGAIIWTLATS
jgi:cytochrome b subunit of formate dehydrogenase